LWYAHVARKAKKGIMDDMFHRVCVFAAILAAPTLAAEQMYSVVLSGTGTTTISSMATDPQGNAYIAGRTNAADFPVTPGAFQTKLSGTGHLCQLAAGGFPCYDAFVAKLDPTGKIVWATFLGGSKDEYVNGIAFDPGGNVYVAGYTWSPDFPTTATVASGVPGYFAAKLSPDGASLIYSFLFNAGTIGGLAVDPRGNAYVAGMAGNMTPTPNAFQTQPEGGYVGKLNQVGSGWDYLTFLGGSDQDTATGVAVNASGEAYVAGRTSSANFPGAVRGAQKTLIGSTDLFVAKLTASGSGLYWSTYLGTGGDGLPVANIALDASGGVYVATAGEFVPSVALYKLTPDGSAFVYSKTLGIYSQYAQYAPSIVVNAAGEVYLGGTTDSQDLPTTPGALEGANYIRSVDGYILKFDATGSKVLYGSYFSAGSVWTAGVQGIGLDASGHLYAAGSGEPAPGNEWWGCVVKTDLTQTPPVWLGAALNSASYIASEIAPGELVTLFGAGIGPATPVAAQAINGKLPTELGGVEVLVNGVAAPLLYVSSGQINAIVPFGVPVIAEVVVAAPGGQSNAVRILTTPSSMFGYPVGDIGVFTRDASGQGQAAALNQDGTLNSPSNPAPRGSIVAVWIAGAGPTDPPEMDGEITPVDGRANLTLPLVAIIGDSMETADVVYAGVAPGLVAGVDQVNFRIPDDAATGPAVPLTIRAVRSLLPVQIVAIAVQ
jgi:uncharacterized protein (TIGR03437 family)